MIVSFVFALRVDVSDLLLSDGLLLDDLSKLRLELRRNNCVLVVEILQTFHDLLGECFLP